MKKSLPPFMKKGTAKKPVKRYAAGGTVGADIKPSAPGGKYRSNDPQSKRDRTWNEFLFGSAEAHASEAARSSRTWNPTADNKRQSNAEASYSYRNMDNPTSRPYSPSNMSSVKKKDSIPSVSPPMPKSKSSNPKPAPKANPLPASSKPTTSSRGGSLGVTTGKTTGSSATRSGTGGKTKETPYQRMMRNARET